MSLHPPREYTPAEVVAASNREIPSSLKTLTLALTVIGAIVFIVGVFMNPDQAWRAFHQNWLFFTALSSAGVTFVAVHRAASLLRLSPLLGKVMDHRLRVLVADGKIRDRELKLCGLTENDLFGQLRQRGIFELDDLRFVFYETKGSISVVRRDAEAENLVDLAVRDSVGYP